MNYTPLVTKLYDNTDDYISWSKRFIFSTNFCSTILVFGVFHSSRPKLSVARVYVSATDRFVLSLLILRHRRRRRHCVFSVEKFARDVHRRFVCTTSHQRSKTRLSKAPYYCFCTVYTHCIVRAFRYYPQTRIHDPVVRRYHGNRK